jgi:sialic acid synthase SpsE
MNTHFIAEVSSNHHSELDRCIAFIDRAADIGCQSVKFQLFKIDQLFSSEVRAARPELQARSAWELPVAFLPTLSGYAHGRGLQFSCTPFYLDAVAELEPYVDFYKIASYELMWDDLLICCARTGKPVILSTGMATLEEIAHAVDVLKTAGCEDLSLLHCISGYPTPVAECNLAAISTLRRAFGCTVGWSDHSVDPKVIARAVNYWGATTIEFHLDLDGNGDEYKTGHCWLPEQIATAMREAQDNTNDDWTLADGTGEKKPSPAELPDREWRADPTDGLRPLKATRLRYLPATATRS